jgi:SNF2 family DNA or RNA helicase
MTAKIIYKDGFYSLTIPYSMREQAFSEGFLWDKGSQTWYTHTPKVAARLRHLCDSRTLKILNQELDNTCPWSSGLLYNKSRTPKKFQIDGAKKILSRASHGKNSYLADDPGLGKTFTLTMVMSSTPGFSLIFVPPFLKYNWERELNQGLHKPRSIQIVSSKKDIDFDSQILICPDSLIDNKDIRLELKRRNFSWIMADEAHRFKNDEAKRTIYMLGNEDKTLRNRALINSGDSIVFASGTPMPSRAMELFSPLSALAPETIDFKNKYQYGHRYCAPFKINGRFVYTGSANMEVLKKKTKDFFIRHRKEDHLKELPKKLENVILLGEDLKASLQKFEISLNLDKRPLREIISSLRNDPRGDIARLRKEIGLNKVKPALELLKAEIEDKGKPILIFGWHKEVLRAIEEGLKKYRPLYIDGDTPMRKRDELVLEFQSQKGARPFILNTQAGGVGLTLTKAARVFIIEPDWVPATNGQAIDRAHRIGQTEVVEATYLVFRNSLDEYIARGLLERQANINKIF